MPPPRPHAVRGRERRAGGIGRLAEVPVVALMLGFVAIAMLAPALLAATDGEWRVARGFLYSGVFTGVAAGILGLALATRVPEDTARRELTVLLTCWLTGPLFAAIPLVILTPSIGLSGAIFEMTAAFTTTGGSSYGNPAGLPTAIHLWRATVGWLGGLLTLCSAYVVLAPRRLGGFEVEAATERSHLMRQVERVRLTDAMAPVDLRIRRAIRVILPYYGALTALLGLLLSATGSPETDAILHAMAVLSTSGISATREGIAGIPNAAGEAVAAVFLVAAASRRLYSDAAEYGSRTPIQRDPEMIMMAALIGLVTASLFLRHWIGSLTLDVADAEIDSLQALWGMVFTTLSFVTTTGFVSGHWDSAVDWSGWANPGLILLALCAIGGGAATTAGGIKLIRAYALVRHGLREMERIAQPYSVQGVGRETRTLIRGGPVIVWSFIMLFIMAIFLSMLSLTALRLDFEDALIASIAAIANCGPAFALVAERPLGFAELTEAHRWILAVMMIVGRVETLALIALFNPEIWQGRRRRSKFARQNTGKSRTEAPQSKE